MKRVVVVVVDDSSWSARSFANVVSFVVEETSGADAICWESSKRTTNENDALAAFSGQEPEKLHVPSITESFSLACCRNAKKNRTVREPESVYYFIHFPPASSLYSA